MAILIRRNGKAWLPATRKKFDQEYELRDLLLKTPELIEVLDGTKLLLTKEAGLSGGTSADLLGVTSEGDILIVEAKLAKNYEIRRKVIGQIFEYASRLWKADYATFNDYFEKSHGQSLVKKFAANYEHFDEEPFRNRVDSNLRQGRFHLLIAVDEMSDDLNKILTYISSRGDSVRLEALEVNVFQQEDAEILVPHRHAIYRAAQGAVSSTPVPVSVEYLLDRSVDAEMRSKLEQLLELWRTAGNQVITTDKTFCFKTQGSKRLFSMFYATPNEEWGLQPNFGGMTDAGMPNDLITKVRDSLAQIPGIPAEKVAVKTYPTLKFSQIKLENVVRFAEVMVSAAKEWHDQLAVTD